MQAMHEYLNTVPFDLYELYLFQLVAKHRSFTKAANAAGLTQSAITRQIQGMENSLSLNLLERTTRSVRLTPAGEFLFQESSRLIGDVEKSLQQLREEFGQARKEVRFGVSRTIGMAYLPGFFHANLRRLPEVGCRVSYQRSDTILSALETNELDLGVICPPPRLPSAVSVTHRFEDAFTLIVPSGLAGELKPLLKSKKARQVWLERQNWLLIEEGSQTGQKLRGWMSRQGVRVEPVMQLDSFDLIINLVSLNLGVSFVPIRALALYNRKRTLTRVRLPERFVRELVVLVRKHRKMPKHLSQFVENVLF